MDSYVHGWRALVWGRVWGSVVILTLAWSIGAGMVLRAVSAPYRSDSVRDCLPTAVQPLITTPVDWLWLPVHALVAAPFGLYVSGLQFALLAFAVTVVPAALLPQGTARRVLSAPVLVVLAALLIVAGWTWELAAVNATGLPSLLCSASGY
jgi:hypothetical protein